MAKRTAQGNGTIRERRKGLWEARFTIGRDPGTGKQIQRSVYGSTQQEVRKKLNQVIQEIDSGTYTEPTSMTLGAWLDSWVDEYTINLKDGTIRSYKDNIRLHINPNLGAVQLNKLTAAQIQKFYNKLLKSGRHLQKGQKKEAPAGLSAKTVKIIHAVLHKALNQAVLLGYLKSNPSQSCVLPKVEKKEMKALDGEQIASFIKAAVNHKHFALFYTLLFTGMRRGEIMGLKWNSVNFDEGYIDITQQLQRGRGTERRLELVPLKNSKPRKVYPAPVVLEVLKEHQRKQNELKSLLGGDWLETEAVFCNDFGGFLDSDAVYQSFKRFLKQSGIPDIRVHDLRHTYATTALSSGVDIKTVQDDLGHHDAAFTLNTYAHATMSMKKDSSARMQQYINSVVSTENSVKGTVKGTRLSIVSFRQKKKWPKPTV